MSLPQLAVSTPPLSSPVRWRWSGQWRLWRSCAAHSASTYGRLVPVQVSSVEGRGDAQREPTEPAALRQQPRDPQRLSTISYAITIDRSPRSSIPENFEAAVVA